MTDTKINLLGNYRELDEKTPQGEVEPGKETLNPARVRSYLDKNGLTIKNFEQKFNVKTALDMVASSSARGEAHMYNVLHEAQSYLEQIGLPNLMEQTNEAAFRSTLNKELLKRNESQMEEKINNAYETYITIRELCRRSLVIREEFKERRDAEKIPAAKSLTETLAGGLKKAGEHWDKVPPAQQAAFVGALLVGLVLFIRSKDEGVKAFREDLMGALKVAGVGAGIAVVGGIGYKILFGESPIKSIKDAVNENAGQEKFLSESFKTDNEKAAILRKSTVYMGDKDFLDMARRYREAKAINSNEVRLRTVFDKNMNPKEIYTALDVFFSRYPVEKLEQRYRNYKPRPSWDEVVATEMAEDGLLSYKGSLVDRTIDNVEEYATRGWNWLLVGEGFGVARYLYLKVFGKEGTDEDVKKWIEKNKDNAVDDESQLSKYFEQKLIPSHAENYKKALQSTPIPGQGVRVWDDGKDLYVIAKVTFDVQKNEKALGEARRAGIEKADAFIASQIPEIKDNLPRFREVPDEAQVRVTKEGALMTCVRCPKKGSHEFDLKLHGLQKVPAYEERRGVLEEIFSGSIDYAQLPSAEKERLRLRFSLSSAQENDEIKKLCEWFSGYYKTQNLKVKEVYERMFTNDDDMKKALQETGITPQKQLLKGYLLENINDDADEIESDAAKEIKGDNNAYINAKAMMKREMGYKVRLALIGDPAAQRELHFDPARSKTDKLLDQYEEYCEKLVERMNKG